MKTKKIEEIVLCKVWTRKKNNQKQITIPSKCGIKGGDLVIIKKIKEIDLLK